MDVLFQLKATHKYHLGTNKLPWGPKLYRESSTEKHGLDWALFKNWDNIKGRLVSAIIVEAAWNTSREIERPPIIHKYKEIVFHSSTAFS